jgi:transposase
MKPEKIKISNKKASEIKGRLKAKQLEPDDYEILGLVFNTYLWLYHSLDKAKLTIHKLNKFFGFKSESKKKLPKNSDDTPNESSNDDKGKLTDSGAESPKKSKPKKKPAWNPKENHGRLSADAYTGCPEIPMLFTNPHLINGKCPECFEQYNTEANLTCLKPKTILLLDSQPLVSGVRYQFEYARCIVCNTYFTAPIPDEIKAKSKYSVCCKSTLAIVHYYATLPFKRIEMLQKAQGVPLSDSTQFDLVQEVYHESIEPIMPLLECFSAQGKNILFDDTAARVLEQISNNKKQDTNLGNKAIHATAIVSEYQGHIIYLFYTNTLTAGKQLAQLLEKRENTDDFSTMSDASTSNFSAGQDEALLARWIICLCLTHSRRKFVELADNLDDDAKFVVKIIGNVYHNESHCKQENLDAQARLLYHQQHSAPLMAAMHVWLNNLLLHKQIEPNSLLGQAITYLLKRWHWFTQFLRVAGVSIDNNLCEQAIKVLIRYRRNSLFYRTFNGASIGDAMMSLIHTAVNNNINIFDYFNALQVHKEVVNESPEKWLPWCYQETIEEIMVSDILAEPTKAA